MKEEANQCSQARLEKMDRDLLMYGDLLQHIGDESLQNGTVLQAIYRLLRSQYGQSSDLKGSCSPPESALIQPNLVRY